MTNATTHIALVAPGGPITHMLAAQVSEVAASLFGPKVALHFHPQCFLMAGHFAGTDKDRTDAFLEVANNPDYHAVWFARGGYGACRLDNALFDQLNEHARTKKYLGYSDTGTILGRLYRDGIGNPVHGPMPTDFPRDEGKQAIERALRYLVDQSTDEIEPTAMAGTPVAAFNITVFSHMIGTPMMPGLSDHIIMLEDVGEYLYRTDRSLFTITNDSGVRASAGIKLGRLSDIPENDRPFGATEEEVVSYWCERAGIPYLGRADIGHDAQNKIVPFGSPSIS